MYIKPNVDGNLSKLLNNRVTSCLLRILVDDFKSVKIDKASILISF